MDWVFDGADILYAIRAGYRGSNSFHNANRVTYKVIENYAAVCSPAASPAQKHDDGMAGSVSVGGGVIVTAPVATVDSLLLKN